MKTRNEIIGEIEGEFGEAFKFIVPEYGIPHDLLLMLCIVAYQSGQMDGLIERRDEIGEPRGNA